VSVGCILLRQREPTGAGADELREACLDVVPAASLRIDQGSHRRCEIGRLD
jgi:hypothetical protein